MQILSTLGTVLFTSAASTLRDAIVEALRQRVNLSGANLSRADLSRADLYGANLYGANLYGANLSGADLSRANLSGANLSGADLSRADLSRADLSRADLSGANLSRADLYGANLYGANLYGANLYGANLSGADLSRANLSGADLSGADLSRADLSRANLSRADLSGAKNAESALAKFQFIPEEGSFVGWKKCKAGVVVKLLITETAKRSHGAERKCRASEVKVLAVFGGEVGVSNHDGKTQYRIGETVVPDSFSENRWDVCAPGIHFFLTRKEAEDYTV